MNDGLTGAAEAHLRLLADDHDVPVSLERYYFRLAADYGVSAGRIAELSGRSLARVHRVIGGR
jgi:hypothetical protein